MKGSLKLAVISAIALIGTGFIILRVYNLFSPKSIFGNVSNLSNPNVVVPDGWRQYKNNEYSFSLAFPKEGVDVFFTGPPNCVQIAINSNSCTPSKSEQIQNTAHRRGDLYFDIGIDKALPSNVKIVIPKGETSTVSSTDIQVGSTHGKLVVTSYLDGSKPNSTGYLVNVESGEKNGYILHLSSKNVGQQELDKFTALMRQIASSIQF